MKALAYHMVAGHAVPDYFDQNVARIEGSVTEDLLKCIHGRCPNLVAKPSPQRFTCTRAMEMLSTGLNSTLKLIHSSILRNPDRLAIDNDNVFC